jgi:hypothetical protein
MGVSLAYVITKLTERERYFVDYCSWCDRGPTNPIPTLLYERLKQLYGREFADEASHRINQNVIRDVLNKKSTLKFWFADPMELLREAS